MKKPIYVTHPYLPPLEEFIPYLQQIWDKKILTNGGPFHQQLEQALCNYLGVKHIVDLTRFHRHVSAPSKKLLECQRAQKVKMTVPADSIVETLDVIEHV